MAKKEDDSPPLEMVKLATISEIVQGELKGKIVFRPVDPKADLIDLFDKIIAGAQDAKRRLEHLRETGKFPDE